MSTSPSTAPVTVPATAPAAGTQSYIRAEQTAGGFRLTGCVVPGTTQEQMTEALQILVRTLAAGALMLPVAMKDEELEKLRAGVLIASAGRADA